MKNSRTPTKSKGQPSISRFFKSSPKKQSTPPQQQNVQTINIDDDGDDQIVEIINNDDINEIKPSTVKTEVEIPNEINIERKKQFQYEKTTDIPIINPTTEQILLRESLKEKLSQKFSTNNNPPNGVEESQPQSDLEDDQTPQPPPKKKQKTSKQSKLTPLDQQVKDLKLLHLDKILAIQVGYKYKFYCEDAVKVHKILNIMLVPGKINIIDESPTDKLYNKLAYCSIPEPRLHIHLQRLLDRGLKIGIVDQIETSAIKSVESKNSALFKRRLSNVFTKSTYIEYDEVNQEKDKNINSLLSIVEESVDQNDNVLITLVSIQPLTGEIIYDTFQDDFLRNELETRLLHMEPIEFIYFENDISELTESCFQKFISINSSNIRINKIPILKKKFFESYLNDYVLDNPKLFEFISEQSKEFQTCCSLLIDYLKEFQLDSSFKIVTNYSNFIQKNHMILNSNSLTNLEIFINSTNNEQFGSLLWLMDHTRTKFGYRLLRKWISNPLIDREQIEKRFDAVENIQSNFNHFLENLANLLKNSPDLEKILNRLHYGKVKRKELYIFLFKFEEISKLIIKFGKFEILNNLKSSYLKQLFTQLIEISESLKISNYVSMINSPNAMDDHNDDHILKYFNLNTLKINQDEIITQDIEISNIKDEFQKELQNVRDFLKRPSMDYVTSSREPYLVEIRAGLSRIVPKDWVKINGSKLVSRYRTPQIIKLMKLLEYHMELYLKACHSVFQRFVQDLDKNYTELNQFIKILAQYDCLLSITTTSSSLNYSRPKFVDEQIIQIQNGRNPIIEQLNTYVPNDIDMNSSQSRCFIITGPNMGGKSSYVKKVALLIIMAQCGCFIPCESATLGVFNSILTRMGSKDDLIKGESTFFIEMSQILNVIQNCHGKSLIILDEVGRGTGTIDGISIASSILQYLMTETEKSLILFITHFPSICKLSKKFSKIKNFHMGYIEEKKTENDWPKVTFLYNLVPGIAKNSYGLNVAKLASINDEIIHNAFEISRKRQQQVESAQNLANERKLVELFPKVLKGDKIEEICDVIDDFD
ncbi:DNA mismatch repair protein [Wickerhamomyces ciferrii]|uniref:DNA mismatch repair protein MSH3 n=1 Tax=Wickerhamomyces ciferrii (strain ATCC 14091 / BCRC 22168 / CBS 111 / JCM 3599 / NBRC 0793 / NRRL Y-1031 F-60-10) TaxID=1206466 RepID=K0KUV3_WICCF|nr:DNA mismatch repair protein [Wickerhamomyces ciferrii]CCH47006.1 DNA mismatch repair protein [Wickerhamomyces ciferrii]